MNFRSRRMRALVAALLVGAVSPLWAAAPPKTTYTSAMTRERALRLQWEQAAEDALPAATLRQARAIVQAYESIVRDYPTSGYCDNALWQAATLEADLFARAGQESDRQKALQLYEFLAREYPTGSLARKAVSEAHRLRAAPLPAASVNPAGERSTTVKAEPKKTEPRTATPTSPEPRPTDTKRTDAKPAELKAVQREVAGPKPVAPDTTETATGQPKATDRKDPQPVGAATKTAESKVIDPKPTESKAAPETKAPEPKALEAKATETPATIKDIKRVILPEIVRVTIELDREVPFHQERVENPARLLFDLSGTRARAPLQDANWTFDDDVVHGIRVGRHPNQTTRVVLDLDGVSRYSVVTLNNPYRILIDCERQAPPVQGTRSAASEPSAVQPVASELASPRPPKKSEAPKPEVEKRSDADKTPAAKPAPLPSDRNRVSMARQLGLGIARVAIDPGHGGHDPGAEGSQMSEAQIVLDIALRLEKLLAKQQGVEVVLTRRTDVFVPLEERTAIANREQADLFLSIHANASRNPKVNGIESYYLNFATNPEAEAVAARENAASGRSMNSLPDIVKAIALNNKLDESKDLAGLVQQSLAKRLRPANRSLRDLGVKQAPFVVLIGAVMPSVLAEVSFVTHRREGELLQTDSYRQRIAEALCDAVIRYRKTLKPADYITQQ